MYPPHDKATKPNPKPTLGAHANITITSRCPELVKESNLRQSILPLNAVTVRKMYSIKKEIGASLPRNHWN